MTNDSVLNLALELAAKLGGSSSHLSDTSILKKEMETCTHYLRLDSCIRCFPFKSSKNFRPFEVLAGTLKARTGMSSDLVLGWESIIGSNVNTKDNISCLDNGSGGRGLI